MVWTILVPTLGGIVCGALLYYVVPDARGSGIPQVKVAYAVKGGRMPFGMGLGKFALGVIQIGTGASLGREGPTVQICAALTSLLGCIAALSRQRQRQLLPVGAAAGIAAAFNAPIAAVTFTIEEVVGDLDQTVLTGAIVAAAIAAAIERIDLGEHPIFTIPPAMACTAWSRCCSTPCSASMARASYSSSGSRRSGCARSCPSSHPLRHRSARCATTR